MYHAKTAPRRTTPSAGKPAANATVTSSLPGWRFAVTLGTGEGAALVPALVGAAVTVGDIVGAEEGLGQGACDGCALGIGVGAPVGLGEGIDVGACSQTPMRQTPFLKQSESTTHD